MHLVIRPSGSGAWLRRGDEGGKVGEDTQGPGGMREVDIGARNGGTLVFILWIGLKKKSGRVGSSIRSVLFYKF